MKRWKMVVLCAVAATLVLPGSGFAAPAKAGIEEVVAEILRSNPAVVGADAELAAAREALTSARADRLPSLSAGYSWTEHNNTPIQKSAGGISPWATRSSRAGTSSWCSPFFRVCPEISP